MIITCPSCGTQLRLGDEHAGKKLRCPKCQVEFQANKTSHVPQNLSASSPTPASQIGAEPAPSTRRSAARRFKVLASVGAAVVIVVVAVVGSVSSSDTGDPRTASDEEIIKASVGEANLHKFEQLRDTDYALYRSSVKAMRDSIIQSGLTCEAYAQKRIRERLIENKMLEWWDNAKAEIDEEEAEIRAAHERQLQLAESEWKRASDARSAIITTGLSGEELQRRQAEYDAALARERAAGDSLNELTYGNSLNKELESLHATYRARAEEYKKSLEDSQ